MKSFYKNVLGLPKYRWFSNQATLQIPLNSISFMTVRVRDQFDVNDFRLHKKLKIVSDMHL